MSDVVGQCLHASALNHPLSGLPTDHVVTLDLCDPEKVKPRDLPLTRAPRFNIVALRLDLVDLTMTNLNPMFIKDSRDFTDRFHPLR